jgi:hypothetical protein
MILRTSSIIIARPREKRDALARSIFLVQTCNRKPIKAPNIGEINGLNIERYPPSVKIEPSERFIIFAAL